MSTCDCMEEFDVIVIGAGAGGLVVAIGASKMKKKVLLVERGHWGGDCTNFGCVPSKAIIASGESLALIKDEQLGVKTELSKTDTAGVLERVRNIRAKIRHHEEPEALTKLGLQVADGIAHFMTPNSICVEQKEGKKEYMGKKFVLACGSHPFIPKIAGIDKIPYLTNETIFDLKTVPKTLAVIGGGPIGCELAQAMQHLGASVTLIHKHETLLAKEPKQAAEVLHERLKKAGMNFKLGYEPQKLEKKDSKIIIHLKKGTKQETVEADALLLSVGRRPNLKELDLDKAQVAYTDKGVVTNAKLQTSQKHIYAIGDVTGPPFFTHLAENHGRTVLRNIAIPFFQKKRSQQPIPRVTYTDPEIASIGLLKEEAFEKYCEKSIAVYNVPFSEVDRAITQSREEGFLEIVTKKWSSKILGATIVGPRAGEMVAELSVAIYFGIPLRKLADIIHAYPTYNLAIRKAGRFLVAKNHYTNHFKFFRERTWKITVLIGKDFCHLSY